MTPASATTRTGGLRRTLVLAAVLTLLAALLAGCSSGGGGPSRAAVRAFLDANYDDDPGRSDTWFSRQPVAATANRIAQRVDPRDRFTEQQATFMRNRDYIVAVFPEPNGSRVELDEHSRMRNRYPLFIGGFWGFGPRSYGPLGRGASRPGGAGAGDFRGGGPGTGK